MPRLVTDFGAYAENITLPEASVRVKYPCVTENELNFRTGTEQDGEPDAPIDEPAVVKSVPPDIVILEALSQSRDSSV